MTLKDVKKPAKSFNQKAPNSLDDFAASFGQEHPDLSIGLDNLHKHGAKLTPPKNR